MSVIRSFIFFIIKYEYNITLIDEPILMKLYTALYLMIYMNPSRKYFIRDN